MDSITKKKLNYPGRAFTVDGSIFPKKDNKFYVNYKDFLLKNIKEKNIKEIYFLKFEKLPKELITDYIDNDCLSLIDDKLFYVFRINCLK